MQLSYGPVGTHVQPLLVLPGFLQPWQRAWRHKSQMQLQARRCHTRVSAPQLLGLLAGVSGALPCLAPATRTHSTDALVPSTLGMWEPRYTSITDTGAAPWSSSRLTMAAEGVGCGAPAAGEAGGDVQPSRPFGDGRVLRAPELAASEEHDAGALVREAVLVRVRRHGRHACDGEVERRHLEAQAPHERQHEGAEAAVDVQADAGPRGGTRDALDVIHNTVRERRRGGNDEGGARCEPRSDGRCLEAEGLLVHRNDDQPARHGVELHGASCLHRLLADHMKQASVWCVLFQIGRGDLVRPQRGQLSGARAPGVRCEVLAV